MDSTLEHYVIFSVLTIRLLIQIRTDVIVYLVIIRRVLVFKNVLLTKKLMHKKMPVPVMRDFILYPFVINNVLKILCPTRNYLHASVKLAGFQKESVIKDVHPIPNCLRQIQLILYNANVIKDITLLETVANNAINIQSLMKKKQPVSAQLDNLDKNAKINVSQAKVK